MAGSQPTDDLRCLPPTPRRGFWWTRWRVVRIHGPLASALVARGSRRLETAPPSPRGLLRARLVCLDRLRVTGRPRAGPRAGPLPARRAFPVDPSLLAAGRATLAESWSVRGFDGERGPRAARGLTMWLVAGMRSADLALTAPPNGHQWPPAMPPAHHAPAARCSSSAARRITRELPPGRVGVEPSVMSDARPIRLSGQALGCRRGRSNEQSRPKLPVPWWLVRQSQPRGASG